jgi:lipid-A-disaccharide synthase
VAVLAGSRVMEIHYVLPRLLFLARQFPDYQFVVAGAPAIDGACYKKHLHGGAFGLVYNQTYELLAQATAAIVASGTATLETALIGVPQVVCYGGNEISYQVAKRLVKTKYISLVNLIMDAPVVTELIQHDMNEARLKSELQAILPGGEKRQTMSAYYEQLRAKVGERGVSRRIADEMTRTMYEV